MEYLKQKNGKPWITDMGEYVPKQCPVCGADMGLFIYGEPVFLCKSKAKHYFGTLRLSGVEDGEEWV